MCVDFFQLSSLFSGISNSCKWEIEYTVSISTMLTFVLKLTLFVSLVYIFSSILYKLNVFTFCVNTVSTNGDALRCRKMFSLNIVLFLNCLYFLFFNNVHPFLLYINTYALLSCFWNRRNSSILGGLFVFHSFPCFLKVNTNFKVRKNIIFWSNQNNSLSLFLFVSLLKSFQIASNRLA